MVLALLLAADRAGAVVAGRAIADELQRTGDLGARPDVTVGGLPFLTQAVRGRYRSIDVSATDVVAGDLRLPELTAQVTGARVRLRDALADDVTDVPVERVDARAVVPYDELVRRSGDRELTVAPEGDRLRLRGEVQVLGRELEATALSRLTVENGALVLTAESFDVGSDVVDSLLTGALHGVFDLRVDLDGLPYGLVVEDVQVQPDGLAVRASADDTVLTTGAR